MHLPYFRGFNLSYFLFIDHFDFRTEIFLVTSYFHLLYCSTKILFLRLVFFGEVGMKVVVVRSTDRTPADWRVQMALHIGTVLGM